MDSFPTQSPMLAEVTCLWSRQTSHKLSSRSNHLRLSCWRQRSSGGSRLQASARKSISLWTPIVRLNCALKKTQSDPKARTSLRLLNNEFFPHRLSQTSSKACHLRNDSIGNKLRLSPLWLNACSTRKSSTRPRRQKPNRSNC